MVLLPNLTCASRKRRPMIQQLRKARLICVRLRRRADVEILGSAAEQQVADSAPHEVGGEAQLLKPARHFQRIGVDVATGEGMLCTWQDDGFNHRLRSIADPSPQPRPAQL